MDLLATAGTSDRTEPLSGKFTSNEAQIVAIFHIIGAAASQHALRGEVLAESKTAGSVAGLKEIVQEDTALSAELHDVAAEYSWSSVELNDHCVSVSWVTVQQLSTFKPLVAVIKTNRGKRWRVIERIVDQVVRETHAGPVDV